jgi:Chitobiase/beta-hexosaminidase C-terminal domain/Legume lectin domain/Bacterial lectin
MNTRILLGMLWLCGTISAQVSVTTQHNDNSRSGQNINETILTRSSVSSGQFGKLFSVSVDGYVYAQPLYVPNLTIPGKGVHNVLFIATEHDSVYALDADSNTRRNSTPLWHASFINPAHGITTISDQDLLGCGAIAPEVGITSTPVIDISTNTIYVLAETKENGQFFHRLHALDITTGAEKLGGPATIQATYPGTGDGGSGGIITFDPVQHLNRPGLLLNSGSIYIVWSSNCDTDPYHGWVMAYNKTTLAQQGVWVTTPNGRRGGIWMSGAGVAADAAGNVYVPTGNGTFETSGSPTDFGDSIVKLALSGNTLNLIDYFTPYDEGNLDEGDVDVASGGALLLPDQPGNYPHELVEAGKEGSIYVVNRDNMGHFNANNNSQIIQNITGQIRGLFSVPAYWNNYLYFGGANDNVKAFALNNGALSSSPTSESLSGMGWPGATPSVSANGTSNGIVWILQTAAALNDGYEVLYAYDATNLGNQLYASTDNEPRDNPGAVVKFAVPTIANGKVYVGAVQQVSVYGLLGQEQPAALPTFSPDSGTYATQQLVGIDDSTPGATIYYTTDGSTPTTSSPVYTNPIPVSQTTTIQAMAAAPGYYNSSVAPSVYTMTTGSGGSLNFGNGFQQLALNGTVRVSGTRMRLTDGGTGESGSFWYPTPVNIQNFTQDFSFQLTNPIGDGIAFVIQNQGTTALGPGGAGLGYGAQSPGGAQGIPTSIAVKFDLYSNFGEGPDSTGLYTNGSSPTIPAIDMTSSGVNLHSGDIFDVHMTYDGTTLSMAITDTVTHQVFSTSWAIDIPTTVAGNTAYVGFTGASGGATAVQDIVSWSFQPAGINYGGGFSSNNLTLNGNAVYNSSRLRLTDGGTSEKSSAWYSIPLNVQAFTQDFSFQLTDPDADGITFTIQNTGATALGFGGAGLGYGATSPGGNPGIRKSVAIKFDIYNNQGEGTNSTGLYVDGASPTVPAVDMTGSGINLRSGDIFHVHMTYDGVNLSMTIIDVFTQRSFSTSWPIDIPGTVGGTSAYVGFTGASGGGTAIQEVLSWSFASPAAINYGTGFKTTGLTLNGGAALNGTRLQLTNGGIGEFTSAWFVYPTSIRTFQQTFSFQLTNAVADGLTFAIQNVGTTVLGPGGSGLGYGQPSPGQGQAGIPASVAVKFDLYNNQGEGFDSTGLYINGASPTVPAVDMTGSGIDLHSGDVFDVQMNYDGTTLVMQITDTVTQASFQTSWAVDIPTAVGGNTAYLGFTAATGGAAATQEILNWTYIP